MLQALIDNMPSNVGPCKLQILSTHPATDREEIPAGIDIIACTPLGLLLIIFPLALAFRFLTRIGVPSRWLIRTPALKALLEADVVLDVAGVSFMDGRGIPILIYNCLMTGTPLLLGGAVVKASQALGPFETPINRLAARLVLPRLAAICARGGRTAEHLAALDLNNVRLGADLAFRMHEEQTPIGSRVASKDLKVVVVPSEVVRRYCSRKRLDYEDLFARFIDTLTSLQGVHVELLPHAAVVGAPAGRMNDLPLCRAIHRKLGRKDRCLLVDESLPPANLRRRIAECDIAVTCRFHAMVSALATATPVVVIGWSHKYLEVLEMFELSDACLGYADLSLDRLLATFHATRQNAATIREDISTRLPAVRESADMNFEVIRQVLNPN